MGVFKQFLFSDVIVTPFTVNKGFSFSGAAAMTASTVSIDRFLGRNTSSLFISSSDLTTGQVSTQYQRCIYNSIKELYYSNYLSGSYGSPINTASLVPGADSDGDRFVGSPSYNPFFENYEQSTIAYGRYFPTASNSLIGVISIPVGLFGNNIQPKSFYYSSSLGIYTDDGDGNLKSGSNVVGNIFYSHGIVTLTSASNPVINNFVSSSNVICSFTSSFDIYETQYKCTVRANEFNFSQNPSLISGSTDGTLYGFASSASFNPYVTTVGLYNDFYELVAVAKLATPLPLSDITDTNIIINLDR
jgi:hypothetical protein